MRLICGGVQTDGDSDGKGKGLAADEDEDEDGEDEECPEGNVFVVSLNIRLKR